MPERKTIERFKRDRREGKSPSTQAGEFVREEVKHVRQRKHGAASARQAIAIGLSKARRAGIKLPVPEGGKASPQVRRQAARDLDRAKATRKKPSVKRSRATLGALKHQGSTAGSSRALAIHARQAALHRSRQARRSAAQKAVKTKRRMKSS